MKKLNVTIILLTLITINGCAVMNQQQDSFIKLDLTTQSGQLAREVYKQEAYDYFFYAKKSKGEESAIYLKLMEKSLRKGSLSYMDIQKNAANIKKISISAQKYIALQHLKRARKTKGSAIVSLDLMESALDAEGLTYVSIKTNHAEIQRLQLKK